MAAAVTVELQVSNTAVSTTNTATTTLIQLLTLMDLFRERTPPQKETLLRTLCNSMFL